jgi:hypothetical protein
MNLLDIAILNNGADKPLIVEAANAAPEIRIFPAMPFEGVSYSTTVVTALPTGSSFRAANNGVDAGKATRENRLVEAFIMNKRWSVDKAVADGYVKGWNNLLAQEALLQMQAAWQDLGSQIYYGTSADSLGFSGFVSAVDSTMVVSAGTGTASTCSSVWGAVFGETDVQLALGMGGKIDMSDPYEGDETGANSKVYRAYRQDLVARPGLQIGSKYSIGRIKNVPAGATGLTDDLLDSLLECCKVGKAFDAIFLTKRSLRQLKDSRTATSASGAPAPWPESIVGPSGKVIPLVVTDSITNTETGDGT